MSGRTWTTQDYVYVTAECLTGVLSVLGNGLVLLAIYRTRALRTVTNCFIGSLAAADMLVGAVIPPTVVLPYRGLPRDFYGCVFMNTVVVLITNISILNLLAVAMERFLAISDPFRYQRLLTKRRALLVVALTWVLAIFIGLIPTMGWNLGSQGFTECAFTQVIDMNYMVYLIFFGVNVPPLVFMLLIYLYIFHIIRKQQRRTVAQMTVLSRDERRSVRQQKREVRGAKGLAYVIILFALCWLPVHICNCITLFAVERSPPIQVLLAAIVLSHANSFINPFLYAFSNSQFKRAMKRILLCGRLPPSYTSDSSDGLTWNRGARPSVLPPSAPATANGHLRNNTNNNANGHAAGDSLSSEDSRGRGGGAVTGNGVVNEAFDQDTDVSEEVTPEVAPRRKKSLRWSDQAVDDEDHTDGHGHTPLEPIHSHPKQHEDSGPGDVSSEVWVTPSSRTLELRTLSQAPPPSSPSQTPSSSSPSHRRYVVGPGDDPEVRDVTDNSPSQAAPEVSAVVMVTDDADWAHGNAVHLELHDVTDDHTTTDDHPSGDAVSDVRDTIGDVNGGGVTNPAFDTDSESESDSENGRESAAETERQRCSGREDPEDEADGVLVVTGDRPCPQGQYHNGQSLSHCDTAGREGERQEGDTTRGPKELTPQSGDTFGSKKFVTVRL